MTATASKVVPFAIEACDPCNCDLVLRTLDGVRLRSLLRPIKTVFSRDPQTGEMVEKSVSANLLPGMPTNVPGMILSVNPTEGTWKVTDPLCDDEELCEKIRQAINHGGQYQVVHKLRGVPPQQGKMDKDLTKTLVREMLELVEKDCARLHSGVLPTREAVDAMPGDYLLFPRNPTEYAMPRYEKDLETWRQAMNQLIGGLR